MKRILHIGFLLVGITFSFSSFSHPLKVTASLIEYDENQKNIRVECKVFVDDFLQSIGRPMNVNSLNKKDITDIESYFNEYYIIKIKGKKFTFKYDSSYFEKAFNVLTIKFSESSFTVNKGDNIDVKNALLFDVFGFLQSNRMELRFPPFFQSKYFETTKVEDSYTYTF
ncbi:DUF6702 family protein [uncultured Tenacibaculum sp.]|uniref:DUF6702 family protein n=1 Tax=uncultured Tenacibaculum sp. TaxID=174713 RepID=UPI00261559D0|nr:DUF6702 family protein [uncultured Tenacibaculum sp.]